MAAKKTRSRRKAKPRVEPESRPRELRLSGKIAVVTGGSRGIGYAIAQALAAEGCSVVITGRDKKTLAASAAKISGAVPRRARASVVPQVCDVRDPQSVTALFAMVKRRFGRLDILINNAGISQAATPLEQTSLELWRDVIETDLTGVFLCTRAALPLMNRGAIVINNLSAAAKQVFPNYYAYTAAKTGALGFTLSLRAEMIPRGIRVTALMPGATKTDIWQQIMPNAPFHHMIDADSVAQAVLYAVLLPPNVNPSEISLDPTGGAL
ncbi:MAG: SDR family NAD(P)-dependent oxidoreductase [Candidatus Korobacteraceae bacterium]|jgi:NAD(P)-dependent dehydrogenase (short-subunit alcohol dehydrogenase family)